MVKRQSILVSVTDPNNEIKLIEYKSKKCGSRRWHEIDLDKHRVYLTIGHADEIACQQNNYGIYTSKDRLWLQIDGSPEFEIEDIRISGHASYHEEMEKSLCPNHS